MKYSKIVELTAGSDNTLLMVPSGYDYVVTYLYLKNRGDSASDVSAHFVTEGNSVAFLIGKNITEKEVLDFGGLAGTFIVMKEGDSLVITPSEGSDFVFLASFEAVQATPRVNV